MLHLLHGEERFLLDSQLKEIVGEEVILRFDMAQYSIQEVLEEANSFGFLEENKVILVDDCSFLESEKALIDSDLKQLEEYLSNPNPTTTLVFKAGKIDKRKKLTKRLLKEAQVFEGKAVKFPQSWLKKQAKLHGFQLDDKAANYMVAHLGNDLYLLDNELIKLATAYPTSEHVTEFMMEGLLSRTLESDIFQLLNAIADKEERSITLLDDILMNGNDAIAVTLALASKVRAIHQVLLEKTVGITIQSSMHPYVLQIAREQSRKYTIEFIEERLEELAELELNMKRGLVEKNLALELFIIKWLG